MSDVCKLKLRMKQDIHFTIAERPKESMYMFGERMRKKQKRRNKMDIFCVVITVAPLPHLASLPGVQFIWSAVTQKY